MMNELLSFEFQYNSNELFVYCIYELYLRATFLNTHINIIVDI